MAFAQRLDVEEGKDLVRFEQLEAGNVTCGESVAGLVNPAAVAVSDVVTRTLDNFAEYTGSHHAHPTCVPVL